MKSLAFWCLMLSLITLPFAVDASAAVAKFRGKVLADSPHAARVVVHDRRFAQDCAPVSQTLTLDCDCAAKSVNVVPAEDCHIVSARKRRNGTVIVDYDKKKHAGRGGMVSKELTSPSSGPAHPTEPAPAPNPPKE